MTRVSFKISFDPGKVRVQACRSALFNALMAYSISPNAERLDFRSAKVEINKGGILTTQILTEQERKRKALRRVVRRIKQSRHIDTLTKPE